MARDKLFECFAKANMRSVATSLLTIKSPSIHSLSLTIFESALEKEEDLEVVRLMLGASFDPNTQITRTWGYTLPLYTAVCTGNKELVHTLLDASADANRAASIPLGNSLLQVAYDCRKGGHEELVKILISARLQAPFEDLFYGILT
jgi:hypothetical protein